MLECNYVLFGEMEKQNFVVRSRRIDGNMEKNGKIEYERITGL